MQPGIPDSMRGMLIHVIDDLVNLMGAESAPDERTKLVYCFAKCLAYRLQRLVRVDQLLRVGSEMAELCDHNYVMGALGHYYFSMATLTLIQVGVAEPSRRTEASTALGRIDHALRSGVIVTSIDPERGWDVPIHNYINAYRATAGLTLPNASAANGLQHLADAAVGETEDEPMDTGTTQGIAAAAQQQMGSDVDWFAPLEKGFVQFLVSKAAP
jgi:hypothetical protein